MKLSDFKGEEALDVLAELIEPAATIMADPEVSNLYKSGKPKILLAKHIIKNHKKEVITILAVLDEEDPNKYGEKITLVSLPLKVIELLSDEDLLQLFQFQGQTMEETSSGSATEITEAKEK